MIKNKPYYILENGEPKREDDVVKWAKWFERTVVTRERNIDYMQLVNGYYISTVFLGLDHNFGFSSKPVLYETWVHDQIFGEDYFERYTTRKEAEKGFKETVKGYKYKSLWRVPLIVFIKVFPTLVSPLSDGLKNIRSNH